MRGTRNAQPPPIGLAVSNKSVQSVNAAERTIEEVVVAAEKRTESLQDLSQAVTALTARDIEHKNLRSFVDLSAIAPGVTVAKNEGLKTIISIRGVGNEANQNAIANPSVSYHMDGIYVASPYALQTDSLFKARGAFNVPIGHNLAMRTSLRWVQQDGYTDNVYSVPSVSDPNETFNGEDLDDTDSFFALPCPVCQQLGRAIS